MEKFVRDMLEIEPAKQTDGRRNLMVECEKLKEEVEGNLNVYNNLYQWRWSLAFNTVNRATIVG